jgi:hypothetical protein
MRPLRRLRLSTPLPVHSLPKKRPMSLQELSPAYQLAADLLRERIRLLRQQLKQETDPVIIWKLKQRINALRPMLQEMNELAELTAHYYDRGYHRNEKYTL